MKKKILSIIIIFFLLFCFFVFLKSLDNTSYYVPSESTGKKVLSFSAKKLFDNQSINSDELFSEKKFYLLNIWSSWCVPCRQEHPLLMNLNLENKLNIIGMNYKDNLKNAENFLKELGNPYKEIFIDLDGTIAIEWGAYGVPESFLIYNNEIIKKYIGPLNQELVDEINLLIK